MRVQLFIPCFIDQLYPQTAFNMVKVLEKAACDVHYNTNQTCCGQPAYNAGFAADSKAVALKFLKDFEGADYIVAPSASCVGFVRNYYPALFDNTASHNEVKNIGNRIFEFTEFLIKILKIENFGASLPVKATYHDSCAGLRECKIKEEPRRLLNQVQGLELLEMEDNETCCGFGGTFAVKFDPISIAMAEQKIGHAMDTGATHLISTDHSCLMHIVCVIKNKKLSR